MHTDLWRMVLTFRRRAPVGYGTMLESFPNGERKARNPMIQVNDT